MLKRNKLPLHHFGLTTTGTNWTQTYAYGLPYQALDGRWRLRFNIGGTLSGSPTSFTLTIVGITTGTSQAVTAYAGDNNGHRCAIANNTIRVYTADAMDGAQFSGDVILTSKPSFLE